MENFDNFIYEIVKNIRSDRLTTIMKVLTEMGGIEGLFFITAITVIIMSILKKRKFAIGITLNLIISTVTYVILKNIVQRPRPPI